MRRYMSVKMESFYLKKNSPCTRFAHTKCDGRWSVRDKIVLQCHRVTTNHAAYRHEWHNYGALFRAAITPGRAFVLAGKQIRSSFAALVFVTYLWMKDTNLYEI